MKKYQLLKTAIFLENVAFRIPHFSGYAVFINLESTNGLWNLFTQNKTQFASCHIDNFSLV